MKILHYTKFGAIRYWRDFKLAVLSTVWKETHAYSINGIDRIWRSL